MFSKPNTYETKLLYNPHGPPAGDEPTFLVKRIVLSGLTKYLAMMTAADSSISGRMRLHAGSSVQFSSLRRHSILKLNKK
jgi:hypothetical protein